MGNRRERWELLGLVVLSFAKLVLAVYLSLWVSGGPEEPQFLQGGDIQNAMRTGQWD